MGVVVKHVLRALPHLVGRWLCPNRVAVLPLFDAMRVRDRVRILCAVGCAYSVWVQDLSVQHTSRQPVKKDFDREVFGTKYF